jgi:hypothetical protein
VPPAPGRTAPIAELSNAFFVEAPIALLIPKLISIGIKNGGIIV